MTDTLNEIRDLAAQFAADRLRPGSPDWDQARELDVSLLGELGDLGFSGLLVPEELGGLGLDADTLVVVVEEMARGEPAVAIHLGIGAALAAAIRTTPAAGALTGIAGGTPVWGQVVHSARHTSALKAARVHEGWRLNGSVPWIMAVGPEGVMPLVAETEPGPALFLVPTSATGCRQGNRMDTIGLRSARFVTVDLNDVEVADTALVAPAASLGEVLVRCETCERLVIAATAVGIARAALELARGYADTREQFGRRLRQFEGIRVKLANMAGRVATAGALVANAAAAPEPAAAALAKVVASEAAMRVTTDAVQIFGGYGYMRDYPVEKLMREAKTTELLMGTNDGLRTLVVNAMYAN